MRKKKKQQKPEKPVKRSPNLLNSFPLKETKSLAEKEHRKIIMALKIIIIMIQGALITVLVLNARADRKLKEVQTTAYELSSKIDFMYKVQKETEDTIRRTEIYKLNSNNKNQMSERITSFLKNVPQTIHVLRVQFEKDSFKLYAESSSALEFSIMIGRYFEEGLVSEIYIDAVDLTPYTGIYQVSIEGKYK